MTNPYNATSYLLFCIYFVIKSTEKYIRAFIQVLPYFTLDITLKKIIDIDKTNRRSKNRVSYLQYFQNLD